MVGESSSGGNIVSVLVIIIGTLVSLMGMFSPVIAKGMFIFFAGLAWILVGTLGIIIPTLSHSN